MNRFLPRSADHRKSFFLLLKLGWQTIDWSTACEKVFNELKRILAQLSTLQPSKKREMLTLYKPTNYPLLQTLHKPNISCRLTEWEIELSEYNITFLPTKAIKAQALTDFVAGLTPRLGSEEKSRWQVHVNGSVSSVAAGPRGERI